MHRNSIVRAVWTAAVPISVGLLIIAGCSHSTTNLTMQEPGADPSFVGNEACKPCHEAEFSRHHLSYHDVSMRTADCKLPEKYLPAVGVVPLAGYAMEREGDSLLISRESAAGMQKQKLDLVLGSGKLGMTYIAMVDRDKLMETKMSYFPPYGIWDITPGQEVHVATDQAFGRVDTAENSRRCLRCHSTTLPPDGQVLRPDPKFYGVGCEACHGAGKPHIDAVRSGKSADLKMVNLARIPPSQLNALCGKCHRNASDVDVDTMEASQTHRFQPFALIRSACRNSANEPLSCLYCHDAHTNVNTDPRSYEAVCLGCHSPQQKLETHLASLPQNEIRVARVCPVNNKGGCIACHMRPKFAFPRTSLPAKMADHLISPPGSEQRRVTPHINVGYN